MCCLKNNLSNHNFNQICEEHCQNQEFAENYITYPYICISTTQTTHADRDTSTLSVIQPINQLNQTNQTTYSLTHPHKHLHHYHHHQDAPTPTLSRIIIIIKTLQHLPCPDLSRLGESQRELRPTLYLYHPLAGQPLHHVWNTAALTSSSAQLAKISISPAVHDAKVRQGKRLRVTTAACHLNHTLAYQGFHLKTNAAWLYLHSFSGSMNPLA